MGNITHHSDYRLALAAIKQRIQSSQTRAVLAVNAELLSLYWDVCGSWMPGSVSAPGVRRWWSKWHKICRPATLA